MAMLPQRELQALREVGQTTISGPASWALVLLFLLTVVSVPLLEPVVERLDREAGRIDGEPMVEPEPGLWREFSSGVSDSLQRMSSEGLIGANHQLQAVMDRFELRLEEESFLRIAVLPPLQGLLSTYLGVGNEQAYVGRSDWLFYRPDVDYVTGRGFFEEAVQKARILESDSWTDPPRPDPLPALVELQTDLLERGIHLLVMPTPVKPTLEPGYFSRRYSRASPPLENPSYGEFCRRLEMRGVDYLDVAAELWQLGQDEAAPLFLRTDTHWAPKAVEQAARYVGMELIERGLTPQPLAGRYLQRSFEVESQGDIARMLTPTPAQAERWRQRVTSQRVVDATGRPWRSDPRADILLLGDSFSNVYSDPGLGWGVGSGLAEQLSFVLQSPVDKIALNAGGALAARRALRRHLVASTGRLDGKRVVIYQFAVRELSQGDWRLVGVD
jgi:hypothetical protein